jgi:anti-sigma factor RsiW
MTCLHEGILRARLDGELSGSELEAANQHLAVCTDCHSRFEKLSAETARTQNLWQAWHRQKASLARQRHMRNSPPSSERG